MSRVKISCHYCGQIQHADMEKIANINGEPKYYCRESGDYRTVVFIHQPQMIAWKNLKRK